MTITAEPAEPGAGFYVAQAVSQADDHRGERRYEAARDALGTFAAIETKVERRHAIVIAALLDHPTAHRDGAP